MDSLASPNDIDDQAVRWAVEAAYGDMTPDSHAELEAWLAADVRHRGAFVRARAWMRATEDAVVAAHSPATDTYAEPTTDDLHSSGAGDARSGSAWRAIAWRWSGLVGSAAAAMAACMAALVVAGVPIPSPFRQADTISGRIVRLKDGSVATLGEDARIEVALSGNYRRITLLSGQATFDVAQDRSRPFVVRSGDVYAQATGTVYSVRRLGRNSGKVEVSEGSVLVWPRDERDQAVLVRAGGSVTLDPGPLPAPSSPVRVAPPKSPPPALAHISLDDVSVRSAVQRFNRVNSTKIVIADPEIGEIKLIGLYRADDPERFARTVAVISGGEAVVEPDRIVIKSK